MNTEELFTKPHRCFKDCQKMGIFPFLKMWKAFLKKAMTTEK